MSSGVSMFLPGPPGACRSSKIVDLEQARSAGRGLDAAGGEVDLVPPHHREDAVDGGGDVRPLPPGVGGGVVDVHAVVNAGGRGAGAVEGFAAEDVELAGVEDGLAHPAAGDGQRAEVAAGRVARRPAVGGGVVDLDGVEAVAQLVAALAPAEDEEARPVGAGGG